MTYQDFLEMSETYHAILDDTKHPLHDCRHPMHGDVVAAFNELDRKITEYSAGMGKQTWLSRKTERGTRAEQV